MWTIILAGTMLIAPAAAQTCPAIPLPLPADLTAFADALQTRSGGTLTLGRAATVAMVPAPGFALPPGKPPAAGSLGGTVTIRIADRGTYRVALGAGVWIDLIRDGKAITSTAHGHGPPCSPIMKMVDFALDPGTYLIQLSGSTSPRVTLLVSRH